MSQDGGSGYRMYVFEESTRCCAIDCKGQGCKEVIYLHIADVSCTQGVCESMGLSYGGPCGGVLWQYTTAGTVQFAANCRNLQQHGKKKIPDDKQCRWTLL